MRLSIVIPTLNEAARIEGALTDALRVADQVIVADGGSDDDTTARAEARGVRVVRSERGRGAQLNAGAAASDGDVLLFLHADCRLPEDARPRIEDALANSGVVAGAFKTWHVPERPTVLAPLLHIADLRSRYSGLPYGDQALFVRRSAFDAVGGFPDQPLLEDLEIARRLWTQGRIARVDARVCVSGRRLLAQPLRTLVVFNTFPLLYRLGVPSAALARWYGWVR